MLRIYSGGEQISYTAGDSFLFCVGAEDGFAEGTRLYFQVAENESADYLINKTFALAGDGFEIVLTEEERKKLSIGNYIYKLVVVDAEDVVITRKSGELIVKWGA